MNSLVRSKPSRQSTFWNYTVKGVIGNLFRHSATPVVRIEKWQGEWIHQEIALNTAETPVECNFSLKIE